MAGMLVEQIARALLYEGYLLYPYRTSSLKNCRPCAFGSLYPRAYCQAHGDIEPCSMHIECLVRGDSAASVHGRVQFLQTCGRERAVVLPERGLYELVQQPAQTAFSFADADSAHVEGVVERSVEPMSSSVLKVRIRIENQTPADNSDHVMLSTHAILEVHGAQFLSLIDPPPDACQFAQACQNRGAWPVLVGDPVQRAQILAAPIILYDYPSVAPESPGDLFDGTEIDELLTLRILTLTDAEKYALKADERARTLLERTETLAAEQLQALHGTVRRSNKNGPLNPGDHVCVRPDCRGDVLDIVLTGKSATVASCEQDFEGRVFYTLAFDDDPGRDLGLEGKPGHRFFFRRDELDLIAGDA